MWECTADSPSKSGPARDGLVIRERSARAGDGADGDVVHRSARRGGDSIVEDLRQRAKHGVDNALTGLDVSDRDRRRVLGVEHARGARLQLDASHISGIRRKLRRRQTAKCIEHGRERDGSRNVDRAGHLVVRSREIDPRGVGSKLDGAFQPDLGVTVAVSIEQIGRAGLAIGQLRENVTHEALTIIEQLRGGIQCVGLLEQRDEPLTTATVRSDLGTQVSSALVGSPAGLGDGVDHLVVEP